MTTSRLSPFIASASILLSAACASSTSEPQTEPTDSPSAQPTAAPSADPTATADTTATTAPTTAPTAAPTAAPADPKAGRTKLTSEAKNAVFAIARGAISAYEREQVGSVSHALCKSAALVPAKLPAAAEPYKSGDADWGGDAKTGWKCLKFTVSTPVAGQYSYTSGSTPKLAARKLMTGDAQSFEACVELDLDPGGKTTLICAAGKVDPKTKSVKLNTELLIDEE